MNGKSDGKWREIMAKRIEPLNGGFVCVCRTYQKYFPRCFQIFWKQRGQGSVIEQSPGYFFRSSIKSLSVMTSHNGENRTGKCFPRFEDTLIYKRRMYVCYLFGIQTYSILFASFVLIVRSIFLRKTLEALLTTIIIITTSEELIIAFVLLTTLRCIRSNRSYSIVAYATQHGGRRVPKGR